MGHQLGSQLLELELCETGDVWQVLFQLQALRHLRLSVVSQDATSEEVLPVNRKLAQLSSLWLTNCTASVSPLLVGTSLPQLKSLQIDSCSVPGINIDPASMPGLEQLKIKDCKQIKVRQAIFLIGLLTSNCNC